MRKSKSWVIVEDWVSAEESRGATARTTSFANSNTTLKRAPGLARRFFVVVAFFNARFPATYSYLRNYRDALLEAIGPQKR